MQTKKRHSSDASEVLVAIEKKRLQIDKERLEVCNVNSIYNSVEFSLRYPFSLKFCHYLSLHSLAPYVLSFSPYYQINQIVSVLDTNFSYLNYVEKNSLKEQQASRELKKRWLEVEEHKCVILQKILDKMLSS